MCKIFISVEIDVKNKSTVKDSIDISKMIEGNIVQAIRDTVDSSVTIKENYIVS